MTDAEHIAKYGHVRAPIAVKHAGTTFVAVGERLLHDPRWNTFHDFLFTYTGTLFEQDWFTQELRLPLEGRHPLMQWYDALRAFGEARGFRRGEPVRVDNPPARVTALLSFAYDLYTLEHHGLLPQRLVARLKRKDQFQGARYETYVGAAFVRAGFTIALEDESDTSVSHCEFGATCIATGATYSVEAKSRHRPGVLGQAGTPLLLSEIEANLSGLFVRALRKQATHTRIVFIDVNVPPSEGSLLESEWFQKLAHQLKRLEENPPPGPSLPPAFVFLTNFPYHFVEDQKPLHGSAALFTGFNVAEFRGGDATLVAAKYPAVLRLHDSVLRHTAVPHDLA